MVARQAWRFVAPRRLRVAVRHWLRPTMLVQAERVVARQAWRLVAPRRLRAELKRWPQEVAHWAERDSPQENSLDLAAQARARLPPPPEQLFRCWPDQGPFAFYRGTLAGRKCNHAVRCGGHPILGADWKRRRLACDRYRKRRNRRGAVRCGNRSNHSRDKCAGHARPFQISALDKCRCPLRHFVDRDGRSANRECKPAQARKRQGSRGFRERAE